MIVRFDEVNFVIASLQYQSRNDGAWREFIVFLTTPKNSRPFTSAIKSSR